MPIKIIDISMPITNEMSVYKNKPDKKPLISIEQTIEHGAQETRLDMNLHTGTHFDGPNHMIKDAFSADQQLGTQFVFAAQVLDVSDALEAIDATVLETKTISPGKFILLKTTNSSDETFDPRFVYLEKTGAQKLVQAHVAGVGIDALGIERDQPEHETHRMLMQNNVRILEGLRLAHVPEGNYTLVVAPLSIPGSDATPVRAFLISEGD